MSAEEILSFIERFEGSFDMFHQVMQKHFNEIIQNLSLTWKKMKVEQKENSKLQGTIREQESELTELRTRSEELDRKIEDLNSKKEELTLETRELKSEELKITDSLNKPKLELENLSTKIDSINEKIIAKESENTNLTQKKIDNGNRENELKSTFAKRMDELEKQLVQLKQNNFFTSFLIAHSDEDIPEVDILAAIMQKGRCKLDDLKKQLDFPPIMAVRTIKQLALAGIINLDENTGTITF